MKIVLATLGLFLALAAPLAQAAETAGDAAQDVKSGALHAKRATGRTVRHAGRSARDAVFTRCADGRHTVKGARGCRGHGGVRKR